MVYATAVDYTHGTERKAAQYGQRLGSITSTDVDAPQTQAISTCSVWSRDYIGFKEYIMADIGNNVDVEVKGSILTVKIDLSKPGWESESGKSEMVAKTEGAHRLPDGKVLNLQCYKVIPKHLRKKVAA
jgi:hypothetical protein